MFIFSPAILRCTVYSSLMTFSLFWYYRQSLARLSHTRSYSRCIPDSARILASDKIEPVCAATFMLHGHELVQRPGIKKDELLRIIGEYDGLIVRSATKVTNEVINAGSQLKVIGRAGTGVDNIDVRSATAKGVLVVNTPGGNTVSAAELAMSHILSLARYVQCTTYQWWW
jgi:D-3-phosphoglycerate dehydrogenase